MELTVEDVEEDVRRIEVAGSAGIISRVLLSSLSDDEGSHSGIRRHPLHAHVLVCKDSASVVEPEDVGWFLQCPADLASQSHCAARLHVQIRAS